MPRAIVKIAALKLVALLLMLWLPHAQAAIAISSTRVWPAQDYTRLTIESRKSIRHNMFTRNRIDGDRSGGCGTRRTLNELPKGRRQSDPTSKVCASDFQTGVVWCWI
jgi:P pilus assembly chaperone PapD